VLRTGADLLTDKQCTRPGAVFAAPGRIQLALQTVNLLPRRRRERVALCWAPLDDPTGSILDEPAYLTSSCEIGCAPAAIGLAAATVSR
jgi:hypothetical protein